MRTASIRQALLLANAKLAIMELGLSVDRAITVLITIAAEMEFVRTFKQVCQADNEPFTHAPALVAIALRVWIQGGCKTFVCFR